MKKLLITLIFFINTLLANEVLIINSNTKIQKYNLLQKEFEKDFKQDYKTLDINQMDLNDIKTYLYDEYPDTIYAIGAKAYQVATKFLPEKNIFFSGIVNYKRFNIEKNQYGVSNEVFEGMNIALTSSLFPDLKTIGIIYSDYTKEIYENYKMQAKNMGIDVIGQKIETKEDIDVSSLINNDGFILISDPILLKDKNNLIDILNRLKEKKKVVVSYHEVFIKYGACLIIKADDATIARQVSTQIKQYEQNIEFNHIQYPMGTETIFNKKLADEKEIKYNDFALSIINKVIE